MKQSNIKTPLVFRIGAAVLCVMLIVCYITGRLYARYTATATGSASAKVAKIDCAVNYAFSGYGDLGEIDGDGNIVYAIIEDFSVENTGEVSYTYDLKLKFSKDIASATYDEPVAPPTGITLYAPRDVGTQSDKVTYVYHSSEDSTTGSTTAKTASDLTGGKYTGFEKNKVYYAYSGDGTTYTWSDAALTDGALSVSQQDLMIGQKYYYKILYFIAPAPDVNLTQQQMTLLYKITCTQID